jgi:hypothetical protein
MISFNCKIFIPFIDNIIEWSAICALLRPLLLVLRRLLVLASVLLLLSSGLVLPGLPLLLILLPRGPHLALLPGGGVGRLPPRLLLLVVGALYARLRRELGHEGLLMLLLLVDGGRPDAAARVPILHPRWPNRCLLPAVELERVELAAKTGVRRRKRREWKSVPGVVGLVAVAVGVLAAVRHADAEAATRACSTSSGLLGAVVLNAREIGEIAASWAKSKLIFRRLLSLQCLPLWR